MWFQLGGWNLRCDRMRCNALHYALSRTLSPREVSCVRRTAPTYKADRSDGAHRCHGAAARHHAARDQYRATCSAKTLLRLHLVACSRTATPRRFPLRLITRNLSSGI